MGCNCTKEDEEADEEEVEEKTGETLLDDYFMGKLLGQGAAGAVYLCTKKEGKHKHKEYAVKMVDQVETPLVDIKKEVSMLKELAHPCVSKLQAVYYETFFVCMVMEIYRGGDLIEGMTAHWSSKGYIPIPVCQNITKMMVQGIEWLHANSVVHRDLKGDNYLMDRKEIEHPQARVYLCDFGTVQEVPPGERFRLKCGTKDYWSPEFFNLNYSLPVDIWAIGVIVYGLVTCKMPFKTEDDTRHKPIKISSRLTKDGETFIRATLERVEDKRLTAKQCMEHKFLSSIKSAAQEAQEKWEGTTGNFREGGANAAVTRRRQELLQRVEDAHNAKNAGVPTDSKPMLGQKSGIWSRDQLAGDKFEVPDKLNDRVAAFEWWTEERCEAACLKQGWSGLAPTKSGGGKRDTRSRVQERVETMLAQYGIDMQLFGQGKFKSLEEFVVEVWKGQSQLMLDATQHKKIVRVVDVVLLRIVHISGGKKQYLIRAKDQYPDGRVRDNINQLVAMKKLPHENGIETAKRLLDERIGMQDCEVTFRTSSREYVEERELSPSFPGVTTVYRKEVFECRVTEKNDATLGNFGLGSGGSREFSSTDNTKYVRTYRWLSEDECAKLKLKLRFSSQGEEVSQLIEAPVGYDEEQLQRFLTENNVDVSLFGQEGNKSIKEFSNELLSGKAALTRHADGRIVRIVDLVLLDLTREDGLALVEVAWKTGTSGPKEDAKVKTLNRMPAIKSRPDENMFYAAKRLITRIIKISDLLVSIEPDSIIVLEEESPSKDYAGLPTLYRKVVVSATVIEARPTP